MADTGSGGRRRPAADGAPPVGERRSPRAGRRRSARNTPPQDGPEARARRDMFAEAYQTIRAVADAQMRRQRRSHTLQPTALVNEVFVKLMRHEGAWNSRTHLLASAAQAMRWILTDHARTRMRARRTSRGSRIRLSELAVPQRLATLDLVALDAALTQLEAVEPDAVRVVEIRVYCGLRLPDVAAAAGISLRRTERLWQFARAYLRDALG